MLVVAKARGFAPQFVLFDSWYVPLQSLELLFQERVVHLKGYGFVKVFRTVAQACPELAEGRVPRTGFGDILPSL